MGFRNASFLSEENSLTSKISRALINLAKSVDHMEFRAFEGNRRYRGGGGGMKTPFRNERESMKNRVVFECYDGYQYADLNKQAWQTFVQSTIGKSNKTRVAVFTIHIF